MALRPIRNEPGKFIDTVTNVEYDIRESGTEPPKPTPWWHRVRETVTSLASDLGRGKPVSVAQNALCVLHVQALCAELDVYRRELDNVQAREKALWEQRNALEGEVARLQKKLDRQARKK
jgi:hypothetical protein